jgi:hypothetical protein
MKEKRVKYSVFIDFMKKNACNNLYYIKLKNQLQENQYQHYLVENQKKII